MIISRQNALYLDNNVWVADLKILKSLFMFAFYHGRAKPGNCANLFLKTFTNHCHKTRDKQLTC